MRIIGGTDVTDRLIAGLLAGANIGTDVLSEPRTLVQTRIATPSTGFRTLKLLLDTFHKKQNHHSNSLSVKYQKTSTYTARQSH